MRILIIEDETMARNLLARHLQNLYPDCEIVGTTASVRDSVEWLKNNEADVIFMDVELSDGICFEIFHQTEVRASVIMTTAYDNYAIKAFEEGSVDYLLKPISIEGIKRAMSRVSLKDSRATETDWEAMLKKIVNSRSADEKNCTRERFIVRFNDKIIPVKTSEIAYFYSEDKSNFLMTNNGSSFVVDLPLDEIVNKLDNSGFFKISRNCIVAMSAIGTITKQMGGRLRIDPVPAAPFEMTVSRSRCEDFLNWLEK